jgi:small subunit ribosomal protein S13
MVYIFQTNIVEKKQIQLGLTKIQGLGRKSSQRIAENLGISKSTKMKSLNLSMIQQLTYFINQNFKVGSELLLKSNENIKRLVRISCYRGFRHTGGLPTRGQRTHTNANTCRRLKSKTHSFYKKLAKPQLIQKNKVSNRKK